MDQLRRNEGRGGAIGGVHPHAPHPGQVDDDAVVTRSESRHAVAASAHRQVEPLVPRMGDVALLDSLDGDSEEPMLAVSGEAAAAASVVLVRLGFSVEVVGEHVGEAAALKYLRSIFMKSLEALVLEYASLASTVPAESIVRTSLEHNLGERFTSFMDLLLATNRIHAERRGLELEDAVATFSANGSQPEVAAAAVLVLREAARAWAEPEAPQAGAPLEALAEHLHRTLWT